MAQTSRLGTVATTVRTERDSTVIRYHSTDIVSFNAGTVRLCNNGYFTNTTRTRMNQASQQFRLGFEVYQKDWAWYVKLPNGVTVDFTDGMVFNR